MWAGQVDLTFPLFSLIKLDLSTVFVDCHCLSLYVGEAFDATLWGTIAICGHVSSRRNLCTSSYDSGKWSNRGPCFSVGRCLIICHLVVFICEIYSLTFPGIFQLAVIPSLLHLVLFVVSCIWNYSWFLCISSDL